MTPLYLYLHLPIRTSAHRRGIFQIVQSFAYNLCFIALGSIFKCISTKFQRIERFYLERLSIPSLLEMDIYHIFTSIFFLNNKISNSGKDYQASLQVVHMANGFFDF